MSSSRKRAVPLAIVLKVLFACLLGSLGSQAMAARECWTPFGQTANIGAYYSPAIATLCQGSASAVIASVIGSANQNGSVPYDYGDFKQTTEFRVKQCVPLDEYPIGPWKLPRTRCDYVSTLNQTYRDGRPVVRTEVPGTIDVLMQCGEKVKTAPIGDTASTCKRIIDKYGTPPPSCNGVGNPIDPLTGLKRQQEALLSWGRGHSLSMTYSSGQQPVTGTMSEGGAHSFGRQWSSNLHRQWMSEYLGQEIWLFQRGDGVWKRFGQTTGSDDASQRDPLPFVSSTAPYYWFYKDVGAGAIESYRREDGVLISIAYIDGRRLDYIGSDRPPGVGQIGVRHLIDSIRDETGRTVSFQYAPVDDYYSAIRVVTDTAGAQLQFEYDAAGNVAEVRYPDQTKRQFLYENNAYPTLLTGRMDEGNGRIGTYRYDASGRAIESQTGSLPPWKITWTGGIPPDMRPSEYYDPELDAIVRFHAQALPTPVQAEVTSPSGRQSTWGGTVSGRSAMLASQSQPAGAGCSASTSGSVFDGAGNPTQTDDFNGTRTCKAFDTSRGLELTRFEGISTATACEAVTPTNLPAGARMVSSQWHPDWRRSTRTAEPRRITTLVYNGQPDPFNGGSAASCAPSTALLPDGKPIVVLCKRVEQATTDENGSQGFSATLQPGVPARATSWTYNATGQVLTETNPRGLVVVTNEYYTDTTSDHTIGDLKSSANAAGHLTNFTRYNAYGQVLEMVDPNGITTTFAYDARQRLTSSTVNGQATTYEYYPTGLLKKTTQSGGAVVNYEYDDAHRLVAVSDSLGNRIDYTLDFDGNRTKEEAKDPSGTLKRTMSRVYDALGRAQQTTGRE